MSNTERRISSAEVKNPRTGVRHLRPKGSRASETFDLRHSVLDISPTVRSVAGEDTREGRVLSQIYCTGPL